MIELQVQTKQCFSLPRCAEMSWVDWEMTDLDGGYMYCCDLEEAAAALQEVSSLGLAPSSGLLQQEPQP